MSKVAIKGASTGSGTFTIESPATNTDRTLTLPDQTATLITDSSGVLNIGSGQFYKDASGNVGIGTSSPSSGMKIDVSGYVGSSFNGGTNDATVGSYSFINTNASAAANPIRASIEGGRENSAWGAYLKFSTSTGTSAATERMRLDSSGNLLVGTTTAVLTTTKLAVDTGSSVAAGVFRINGTSNTNLYVCNQSNSAFQAFSFRVNTSTEVGAINCTTTATTYVTSSDYRLKESVQPMVGALSVVQQLKPCTYTWKADGSAGQGFIAHELQAVVPDAVVGEKDAVETYTDEDGIEKTRPKYQGIDTSFLVATLTAAIQELKAIVDAQGAEIAALKGQA